MVVLQRLLLVMWRAVGLLIERVLVWLHARLNGS
jgi:hypothetical protein